ncbi:MAG: hypothetical protein CM1200mP39_20180 [Dehalococcoidia bacterium]|nr:MAG: hypothetical protein CM1200mP39_20180 [Dehalococcoidia bacterium]
MVNNAASGVMRPATELSVKHWDWTMNINARGPWMLSVAASRLMPDGGRIINISSPGSTWVLPAYFAVGVSKAAIEAVTRYLAVELGPKGIAVNTVSPGFVMTEALNAFPDQLGIRDIASRPTPAGRTITPEDVSNVVAMLCSSDAEMIRGQVSSSMVEKLYDTNNPINEPPLRYLGSPQLTLFYRMIFGLTPDSSNVHQG